MKKNKKAEDFRVNKEVKLAGGYGAYAAEQVDSALLRRSVLSCLLWEDLFYQSGSSVVKQICDLVPKTEPKEVFDIAVEARTKQKLRHVPLLLAREMAKYPSHKSLVGKLLPKIILRADELTEFLSLYWLDGKTPLSKQIKLGLASSFHNFDEYKFAKYNRDEAIKIRDVMFLVHPKPLNAQEEELFKKVAGNDLQTPDTWEVSLSAGKDKKETFTRLVLENKLGALAFLRNLRNMQECGVEIATINYGFQTINPKWLLPINYFSAAKANPGLTREIEGFMFKGLSQVEKLPGLTCIIIDVSGSMTQRISDKSSFSRMDVGCIMAVISSEVCERVVVYATAGSDSTRTHKTEKIPSYRGFGLSNAILSSSYRLGGGGIFTRQCLEYIKSQEKETIDRIMVFSDSQDCDLFTSKIPNPFGKKNYIIDVSSHDHGINYDGVWTAEISGWSENFLNYVRAYEGFETLPLQDEVV